MKLHEALDRLIKVRTDAQIDLAVWPDYRTLGSATVRKNKATEELESVRATYRKALREGIATIYVTGAPDRVASFVEVVDEEGSSVVVFGMDLYRRLAERVEGVMGSDRTFNSVCYEQIVDELTDIGKQLEMDWIEYPDPTGIGTYLPTPDDTERFVMEVVRAKNGNHVLVQMIEDCVYRNAEIDEYDVPVLPVVIPDLPEEVISSLQKEVFGGDVVVVQLNLDKESPSHETLIKAYKTIKKQMGSKRGNETPENAEEN